MRNLFLVFGILQVAALGFIVFFVLNGIGMSSRVVLSILFPLFLLIVEYMIYTKK